MGNESVWTAELLNEKESTCNKLKRHASVCDNPPPKNAKKSEYIQFLLGKEKKSDDEIKQIKENKEKERMKGYYKKIREIDSKAGLQRTLKSNKRINGNDPYHIPIHDPKVDHPKIFQQFKNFIESGERDFDKLTVHLFDEKKKTLFGALNPDQQDRFFELSKLLIKRFETEGLIGRLYENIHGIWTMKHWNRTLLRLSDTKVRIDPRDCLLPTDGKIDYKSEDEEDMLAMKRRPKVGIAFTNKAHNLAVDAAFLNPNQSLNPDFQGSHICGHKYCIDYGHVRMESGVDNLARNGCRERCIKLCRCKIRRCTHQIDGLFVGCKFHLEGCPEFVAFEIEGELFEDIPLEAAMNESDIFQKIIQKNSIGSKIGKVKLFGLNTDATKIFIKWMSFGEIDGLSNNEPELIAFAERYSIHNLMFECIKNMNKYLTIDNVAICLIMAFKRGDEEVKEMCLKFVGKHPNYGSLLLESEIWNKLNKSNSGLAYKIILSITKYSSIHVY